AILVTGLHFGRQLWIRVADPHQICRAGHRVHLFQQHIVAPAGAGLGHRILLVSLVAKDDRLGRARLLARGHDFAIVDLAAILLGVDSGFIDALDAVGALLHPAAGADGDVGVLQHAQNRHVVYTLGPVQEVVAAHLVPAVVAAVPGADTAVVDHLFDALLAVYGGRDRTDRLAGRVFALHAGQRLEADRRIGGVQAVSVAHIVAVDADPVHLASVLHLFLADGRNIVFGLTRRDAGVAAGAQVQV